MGKVGQERLMMVGVVVVVLVGRMQIAMAICIYPPASPDFLGPGPEPRSGAPAPGPSGDYITDVAAAFIFVYTF